LGVHITFIISKNSIFSIHEEYFGKRKVKIARIILNNAVKKAKKIIVVSKSTLNDFYQYFPRYKRKVKVIYNGESKKFKILGDREKREFIIKNKPGRYILFIGNNKQHKNIYGIINAFIEIKREFKDLRLIIISHDFKLKDYYVKDEIGKDISVLDSVPDKDLIYYYNCASVFVLPSFYEGFGLPIIEAMACGCPAVTSNVSSLHEIGDDAAIYINPYDASSLTKGIKRVIVDNNFKEQIVKKGMERAKMFNWRNTAEEYLGFF